jgi:sugar phosphate isomerase/epimerase
MIPAIHRRRLLQTALGLPLAAWADGKVVRQPGTYLKLALNAYSFDKTLKDGSMTLAKTVEYCAQHGFEGLDATGYYFPGYPKVPTDEYIYGLKRTAFVNGVSISGTGVRNDFAQADAEARRRDVQMVNDWIEVASKLSAPVIRVFTGPKMPEGRTFDQVLEWMTPLFQECADYGKRHGVIVAVQPHWDCLKSAEDTIRLVNTVNSEWFGVILDVGSLRRGDPYREIEKVAPYAVSWQIKEEVYYDDKATPIDLAKVKAIIDRSGYRGFLPIEALGGGDQRVKVAEFLKKVRAVFGG